jgi:hypothetical protein
MRGSCRQCSIVWSNKQHARNLFKRIVKEISEGKV